jgi:citrate lyase subunit beta/citryl-CoA lyase
MRSLLFVPGDSARKFAKARETSADALILDLEDSVSLDKKEDARRATREMLEAPRGEQLLYVRVNALDTGLTLDDLAAIMPASPSGVVLPKSKSSQDVQSLSLWLDAFEAAHGGARGGTGIIAIATETADSIFGLASYRRCSSRLRGLMWGAEDLSASLGATENRSGGAHHSPYRLARDLCLMAASAAEVAAIDTIYAEIDDLAGLGEEAQSARRDGFAAKAVIHPKHVEVVNSAFEPTKAEKVWARRVVDAFADSGALGVARIEGKMVDKPHLLAAKRILGIPKETS